jgi:hypothetical protein
VIGLGWGTLLFVGLKNGWIDWFTFNRETELGETGSGLTLLVLTLLIFPLLRLFELDLF